MLVALPTPTWFHLEMLAVEMSLGPASQAVDFTVQEKAREGAGRRQAGINGQLFILLQLHLHRHHFIKEGTPLSSSPTMGREGSQGNRAFESEPIQLGGKLSFGWHGPALPQAVGGGLVKVGPGLWAWRGRSPPT